MSKALSMAVAATIVVCAGATTIICANAADTDVSTNRRYAGNRYCQQIWRCGPGGSIGTVFVRVCAPMEVILAHHSMAPMDHMAV